MAILDLGHCKELRIDPWKRLFLLSSFLSSLFEVLSIKFFFLSSLFKAYRKSACYETPSCATERVIKPKKQVTDYCWPAAAV